MNKNNVIFTAEPMEFINKFLIKPFECSAGNKECFIFVENYAI